MADVTTLYDMARKGGNNCWSPNVWKTRLVLNYKNIPYQTVWLTHPEIAPALEEIGVSPSTTGQGSPYTLPTLTLSPGEHIMDSLTIASALESKYPQNPLHLDNNLHNALGSILGKVSLPLIPVFMPLIHRNIIPESASEYFHSTRSARFRMPLEQLEAEKGGQQAWEAAKPGLDELCAFVREKKVDEGPFVMGSQVCYADFVIAGMVESMRRISEAELFERFVEGSPEARGVWEGCRVWMEKDT